MSLGLILANRGVISRPGSLTESRSTLEQAFEIRPELRNALLPLGEFPAILRHLREAESRADRLPASGPWPGRRRSRIRGSWSSSGPAWARPVTCAATELTLNPDPSARTTRPTPGPPAAPGR